jgi:transcriptional regulator of acetoin/glycerol metabolism
MARARREAIIAALERCDYNLTEAARVLRIGRATIYRLVDAYQIGVPGPPMLRGGRARQTTSR